MRSNSITTLTAIVVGVFAGTHDSLHADDYQTTGVVRIRDTAPVHTAIQSVPGQMTVGNVIPVHYGNVVSNGWLHGASDHGWAGPFSPGPHDNYLKMMYDVLSLDAFHWNSPEHGWGRPLKRPIHRAPVQYQKHWPDAWSGQKSGSGTKVRPYHPAVYTPTDTTQLGYYYQRVPFWRPNPAMTPPIPWPDHWHKRECAACRARGCRTQPHVIHYPVHHHPAPQHDGAAPSLQPIPNHSAPPVPPAPSKDLKQSAQNFLP